MLLVLRAQPREDTGLSPAEAVFGAPIVLPNKFLQIEEISVDSILKIFQKLWMPLLLLCLGNSSILLPTKLPAELLSAPLVWVRCGSVVPPLHPFYDGAYTVLRHGLAPSPSESSHETRSSLSAVSRPARQRTPSLATPVAATDHRVCAEARAGGEPCGELPTPLVTVKQVGGTLSTLHSTCI